MPVVDRIELHLGESGGTAFIEVTWGVTVSPQEAALRPSFREIVELIGVDSDPGEDGQSDPIQNGVISERIRTFSPTFQSFADTRQKQLPSRALDEDGLLRNSEISARITLTPLPPRTVVASSNVIRRVKELQQ